MSFFNWFSKKRKNTLDNVGLEKEIDQINKTFEDKDDSNYSELHNSNFNFNEGTNKINDLSSLNFGRGLEFENNIDKNELKNEIIKIQKELEIINSKLETLKVLMENINQRLYFIEKEKNVRR